MAENRRSCLKWAILALLACVLSSAIAVLYVQHKIEHDNGPFFVYLRYWRLAQENEPQYNVLLDDIIADLPIYPGAELIYEDVDQAIGNFNPMDYIISAPHASLYFGLEENVSEDEILSYITAVLEESGWRSISTEYSTEYMKEKRCVYVSISSWWLDRLRDERETILAEYATFYMVSITMDTDVVDNLQEIPEWIYYDDCSH